VTNERGEPVYIMSSFEDISEEKAREQELEEHRDNLETLNEVLRHDLRNDIQLISAYAELLEDHVEEGNEYLEKVEQSASNAVDLTMAARDLSVVMGESSEETKQVDLLPILNEQVEKARESFTHAEITMDESVPQTAVEADEFLHSVFRNLLRNAVQHNDKEHPEVTIIAEQNGEHLDLRIADNGPGIPDSRKDEIFGEGEKGLESGGTGIGLYLVQSLLDAYDGDVWVEDNDPDGAVFVIQLQVAS
jgi:signal transduction histidine kinase